MINFIHDHTASLEFNCLIHAHPDDSQIKYLVFLYGTLLATNGTVPEAEEPGGGGGAGEGEGGALPRDRPQPRQPRHHLHPSRLHHHHQ